MGYLLQNPGIVFGLLVSQLLLVGAALGLSVLLALPLGIIIAPRKRLAGFVLGVLGILYTIPSIAMIILLIPVFGLTATSVIVALVLYAQILLVRNVVAGLRQVDPALVEASKGMGMNAWQRLRKVEIPLALPVILAGLRIATVVTVAIATIGAKFGARNLGSLLFEGIAQGRYDKILAGALTVSLLALGINKLLLELEKAFSKERFLSAESQRPKAPVSQASPGSSGGD